VTIFRVGAVPLIVIVTVLRGTSGNGLEWEAVTVGSAWVVVVWPKHGQTGRGLGILLGPLTSLPVHAMREPYGFEGDRCGSVWVRSPGPQSNIQSAAVARFRDGMALVPFRTVWMKLVSKILPGSSWQLEHLWAGRS
jgi:hypothetical protein